MSLPQRRQTSTSAKKRSSTEAHSSSGISAKHRKMPSTPEQHKFPIESYKDEFREKLTNNQVVVVVAPTGTGKSAFLAKECIDLRDHDKPVVCLLPTRASCITLAHFVSKQNRTILGQERGYSISGEKIVGDKTKLVYMTIGKMIPEFKYNWRDVMSRYSIIIID